MNTVTDFAYKLGCGRYIQQNGALTLAGQEAKRLGNRPYILAGPTGYAKVQKVLEASLKEEGLDFALEIYQGYCTEEKAQDIKERIQNGHHDLLIAVGGGKIMDLAKTSASLAEIPVMMVPTSSATCAAYTPLSVIYTPTGACRGTWYFSKELDCVLVDMDVLEKQPYRLMAAGIADAMAKHVEIAHHQATLEHGSVDCLGAKTLANLVYRNFVENGYNVLHGKCKKKDVWDTVYLAICQTGLISGIARGRYQSALAHALYEEVRTLGLAQNMLHGEIVAVGMIAQEIYLENYQEAQELKDFLRSIKMPTFLEELGIPCGEENLRAFSRGKPAQKFLNGPEDEERFFNALCQISKSEI